MRLALSLWIAVVTGLSGACGGTPNVSNANVIGSPTPGISPSVFQNSAVNGAAAASPTAVVPGQTAYPVNQLTPVPTAMTPITPNRLEAIPPNQGPTPQYPQSTHTPVRIRTPNP